MSTLDFGGVVVVAVVRPGTALTNSVTTDQDYASIYTIPANVLTTNTTLRVTLNFQYATGVSTATSGFYLKLGTTKLLAQATAGIPDSITRTISQIYTIIGTAAPGASVAVEGGAPFALTGLHNSNTLAQPVAGFATNGALDIVPGVAWSATGGTESFTLLSAVVERVN